MTTPVKKYQNVSYKELLAFSEHNPNRARTLISLAQAPLKVDTSLDKLGLKGYTAASVSPSGILSILACINDPNYYALAPKHARTQMLIDLSTRLQQQTDKLAQSSLVRKRKKIHDLIGAAYNGAFFEDKEYMELFNAIGFMTNLQFILMKEAVQDKIEDHDVEYNSSLKGEILFSSPPNTFSIILHQNNQLLLFVTHFIFIHLNIDLAHFRYFFFLEYFILDNLRWNLK